MRFDGDVDSLRRIRVAISGLLLVTVIGTVGYKILGFSWLEAVFQTVMTVTTVGFGLVRPLSKAGEVFTLFPAVIGVGMALYNLGVLFEALTEGHLRDLLGKASHGQADRRAARPCHRRGPRPGRPVGEGPLAGDRA